MIKTFGEWDMLNENVQLVSKKLVDFFNTVWTEIKFPWEEEIVEKLETIKNTIEGLDSIENVQKDRYKKDSYSFNVKVYDSPDFKAIAKKHEVPVELIHDQWNDYIEQESKDFIDSLEYSWLEDVEQSGRSGGWLTMEVSTSWRPDNIKEQVNEVLDNYEYEVEDYDPISKEEYEKKKSSLHGSKFGLGGSEKTSEISNLIELKDAVVKDLDNILEFVSELSAGIEEIKNLIQTGKHGLVKGFEEYLE